MIFLFDVFNNQSVMKTKRCFKCDKIKLLNEFYKHPQTKDGYLGKCKSCTKVDVRTRETILLKNTEWHEEEKKRHRDKYYRLGYKEKHKPSTENKKRIINKHKKRYPEKVLAKSRTQKTPRTNGCNFHHWSYNPEHYKDIIELSVKDHMKAHRFMIYDQSHMMYRVGKTGVLLDTKIKHYEFITNLPF
jgi:hypothetical protein